MTIKDQIIEHYADHVDGAPLFADGFDSAILGICPVSFRVIYSRNKCIYALVDNDDMTIDDAIEYLEYNTFSAYVGEYTPIFIEDFNWL